MRIRSLSLVIPILLLTVSSQTQTVTATNDWQPSHPGFRALAITSNHGAFWVAGVGEGISSSADGQHWDIKNPRKKDGATLVGIDFASDTFGYAYGTGGTLLTTEDGGNSWVPHHFADDNILLASLSDAAHGLFRTSQNLYLLGGSDSPKVISQPSDTMKRFAYTPFLVALTPTKMGALLSEGPYSEAGFLTTTDGGKTWSFYDPPSTGIASFLRVDGKYWATGHEVVGKGKPGGGGSVPLAMNSDDGLNWSHTSNDIHPCHWEICSVCTTNGCLASATLLADFFHQSTAFASIPKGDLTAKWAAIPDRICSIHQGVSCAALGKATDVEAAPAAPKPSEQAIPPLGTKLPPGNALRCMACALEPAYIDDKVEGRFTIHISLQVGMDGTVESVTIQNAPSDSVQQKLHTQILDWLFEPPRKDGKPTRVATQSDLTISVIRPR
jgi:hypothetical protein